MPHGAAAFWTDGEVLGGEHAISSGGIAGRFGTGRSMTFIDEQFATEGNVIAASAIGEEAIVADAMEPSGRVCIRKRRMNSSAASIITFVLPFAR